MSDRKVILKMVMSLDGFVTSPDGTHEWMFEFFGDDSGEWNRRALEEAGVHAMGRRSYEIMGPYWAASDGPIATAMNEKPKAVFSHTLKEAAWGPAEIFSGDLSAGIADLKARDDEGTVLVVEETLPAPGEWPPRAVGRGGAPETAYRLRAGAGR